MLCLPHVGCAMALPLLLQMHVVMSDPERLARLGVQCVELYTAAAGGTFPCFLVQSGIGPEIRGQVARAARTLLIGWHL